LNSKPADRPIKIALLWHSLRGVNLGVGALTISHIFALNAAARAVGRSLEYQVIGPGGPLWYPPQENNYREMIVPTRRKSTLKDEFVPRKAWRPIADCDATLDIGMGDSFSDIYGWRRFNMIANSKAMALLMRKPLILSPQTIGPFKSGYARALALQLTSRCKKIFTRDSPSRELLADMGVTDGVEETVDIAFQLPYTPQARATDGPLRFGLNVSGLLYSGGYTRKNQFGLKADYRSLIDGIINALRARPNVHIILVPHVFNSGGVDDDTDISQELATRFGLELAPKFSSPSDAKSFISGLDILAGSRMHATIAAISSGVAVVPLAYSRKFIGVFRSVDYPLVGELQTESTERLIEMTVNAVNQIPELREAARQSNSIAQRRLARYNEFLVDLLKELP
jgi:polysaccharide pyruvyl transferase WcaK-like protein